MVQIDVQHVIHAGKANEILLQYPQLYPKREIISVNLNPVDMGWFLVIAYKIGA